MFKEFFKNSNPNSLIATIAFSLGSGFMVYSAHAENYRSGETGLIWFVIFIVGTILGTFLATVGLFTLLFRLKLKVESDQPSIDKRKPVLRKNFNRRFTIVFGILLIIPIVLIFVFQGCENKPKDKTLSSIEIENFKPVESDTTDFGTVTPDEPTDTTPQEEPETKVGTTPIVPEIDWGDYPPPETGFVYIGDLIEINDTMKWDNIKYPNPAKKGDIFHNYFLESTLNTEVRFSIYTEANFTSNSEPTRKGCSYSIEPRILTHSNGSKITAWLEVNLNSTP